jgi:hypothetical protein
VHLTHVHVDVVGPLVHGGEIAHDLLDAAVLELAREVVVDRLGPEELAERRRVGRLDRVDQPPHDQLVLGEPHLRGGLAGGGDRRGRREGDPEPYPPAASRVRAHRGVA